MSYTAIIQPKALRDIEEAFRWLADNVSPDKATQWYEELQKAIVSLQEFPNRCPFAPEANLFQREIRQLLIGRRKEYRILFLVEGNTVSILHIRHSRRARLTPDDI
jgi:plasmid stabilization system protein ParE